ncbi:MAG: nicotinate phosphoribosyltransferase [Anaerolineaceae bacterium]|nr:nicotinate phosphoribosyltransferase [Anaerolineaceae bacterium]
MEKKQLERIKAVEPFIDLERIGRGYYADKYFLYTAQIFEALKGQDGSSLRVDERFGYDLNLNDFSPADALVEIHWFTRRKRKTLIAGMDFALAILKHLSGDAFDALEISCVEDGYETQFRGDLEQIVPVLKIRGRYRDFAAAETQVIAYLSRATRVASNVYECVEAANGKPVMFFPARYDLPETQVVDGYAYKVALDHFNQLHGTELKPLVSTDAQAAAWGGLGGGTIPHAAIACFLGDTARMSIAFAEVIPPSVPRVALVDFHNNCPQTAAETTRTLFERYLIHHQAGNKAEAEKYRLFGVRLDTSAALMDFSLEATGDPKQDLGVNPRLVRKVRDTLDHAWEAWGYSGADRALAEAFCKEIKIVVSGGFNHEKIASFEADQVPVDVYAIGSTAFSNTSETNTDFTADVVKVRVNGKWIEMAKVGRQSAENPDLKPIQ